MTTRLTWTKQQDLFLRNIVPKEEKINWKTIKQILNEEFFQKQRSAKQCRERYINYSCFDLNNGTNWEWTTHDLDILYDLFEKFGPRWTIIAKFLPNKSQNSIKNKFYGSLRKLIRKMSMIGKQTKKRIKKHIRYESVSRIIQASQSFLTLNDELKKQSRYLRRKIFELIRIEELDQKQNQIYELINRINKFNLATRSYRPYRPNRANRVHKNWKKQGNGEKDININGSTSGRNDSSPEEINEDIFSQGQSLLNDRQLNNMRKRYNMLENTEKERESPQTNLYFMSPEEYPLRNEDDGQLPFLGRESSFNYFFFHQ